MRFVTMAVLLAAGCGATSSPEAAQAPRPSPGAAHAAEAAGRRGDVGVDGLAQAMEVGQVTVVDVRTLEEYGTGHVPGSVHVGMDVLSPDHPAIKDLPRNQPVYVICEVGGRSAKAADQLSAAGFHAVNVVGGTRAWKASGRPTE